MIHSNTIQIQKDI